MSDKKVEEQKAICGIVMPISAIDGCSESHWLDVRAIIKDSISNAGFDPHLVSDADDIGVIQKRIVQNLYDNPIVVIDVSCKNPNVMFEMGMRLAFDKPAVVIKDDKTPFSFDTAPIEHLTYPRDLRFSQIVDFKENLTSKLKGTYSKAISDNNYSTFLKHFGEFKVAKIDKKEVAAQEILIEEVRNLRSLILDNRSVPKFVSKTGETKNVYGRKIRFVFSKVLAMDLNAHALLNELKHISGVGTIQLINTEGIRAEFIITCDYDYTTENLIQNINLYSRSQGLVLTYQVLD
jgi:hypothetical protein